MLPFKDASFQGCVARDSLTVVLVAVLIAKKWNKVVQLLSMFGPMLPGWSLIASNFLIKTKNILVFAQRRCYR